jgi:hypothetical protein
MEFPQPAINANISGEKGGELYFKYNLITGQNITSFLKNL